MVAFFRHKHSSAASTKSPKVNGWKTYSLTEVNMQEMIELNENVNAFLGNYVIVEVKEKRSGIWKLMIFDIKSKEILESIKQQSKKTESNTQMSADEAKEFVSSIVTHILKINQ